MQIQINYIAVAAAAVASMIIGFLWYSPALFGKSWSKLMKYTDKELKKEQGKMGPLYAVSLVLAVITAFVLSHVISLSMNFYNYPKLSTGLISAFWMWFGFIMPVQATGTIFSKEHNWGLFVINTGYQLAAILAMGLVLGLM